MNKLVALTLAFLLSFGQVAFAQEAAGAPADPAPAASAPADPPPASPPADTSSASAPADTSTNSSSADAPAAAPDTAASPAPDASAAPADTPTDPPADAPPVSTDTPAAPDASSTSDAVQSTDSPVGDVATTQDTVDATALETTLNPEATSSADVVPIATTTDATSTDADTSGASTTPETASTTPDAATSTPDTSAAPAGDAGTPLDTTQPLDVVDTSIPAQPDTQQAVPVQKTQETKIALVPEKADTGPEYSFSLGKKIATQRIEKDGSGRERMVQNSGTVDPVIDNASGTMHVAGSCDSAYFVVLIFKDAEDYARDPQSYILNKAFPCTGGSYSYDIADLPDSLQDGTYYLLIGSEGDHGPWTPITSLTEITLSRNKH